ncbi:late competence development ComFB family protein [Clostridium sp. D2Q-11]|uniref:Late competence development ComFB family protein n=1 Tax=Anaeromonas frigoriresistens TaxID=2683708 RepID=A0A942V519_9FIRM|nr:late competence development ComFB family protein [Anaeromonas frigoriresistens]MBS4540002.1 late competence development ComFB family protein [Anaeromonas frigoriresistens]
MTLYNFMEIGVKNHIKVVLNKQSDMCKCQQCVDDISAIALNNLPPKYIARDTGEIYSKLSQMENQFTVDIIKEITKAINIVSKNPRHE